MSDRERFFCDAAGSDNYVRHKACTGEEALTFSHLPQPLKISRIKGFGLLLDPVLLGEHLLQLLKTRQTSQLVLSGWRSVILKCRCHQDEALDGRQQSKKLEAIRESV